MKKVLGILIVLALLGGGFYYYMSMPPSITTSGPITATHLDTAMPATKAAATTTTVAMATPAATPAAAPAATPAVAAAAPAGGLKKYQLGQPGSTAKFQLGESLRGSPITVVGVTPKVAGEVAVNLADLSTAQVGEIKIDALDLQTDNQNRNNALHRRILETDKFPYIVFKPTKIVGLTGPGAVGSTHNFQIEGNLTIRDVTKPVTFAGSLTVVSENSITGKATSKVNKGDFNLVVPNLAFIANVSEAVTLDIEFNAVPLAG